MKKYMAILGLFMTITSCSGKTDMAPKTMLEEFNLKGKVKTVTYEYETGYHKLYFDENGRLIKQEEFPVENLGEIKGAICDNYVYVEYSKPVKDTITLIYDNMGNWIERTANGNSWSYHYLTTEDIYTGKYPFDNQYVCRNIEYYDQE